MPTLVVLPGMDGTGLLLRDFASAMGTEFRINVLSYPLDEPLGYAELESRLFAELPSTDPYFLLGESFGGPLAVALAARRPVGLLGLVLCASFVRYPVSALRAFALLARIAPIRAAPLFAFSWLMLGKWCTPALRTTLANSLAVVSSAAMRARLESALRVDVSELLKTIEVPLLYLRASNDRIVPRSAGDRIVSQSQRANLVEIMGPHFLLQASPEASAQVVRRFAAA